jgi:succinate-semialdehyde dehydrogenase/glutarate-semialdehyde dehydrogenase
VQGLNDQRLFRQRCYVNGEWMQAEDGRTVPVTNPVDAEVIGSVPDCGASETRKALQAAEAALPSWRALPARERGAKLRAWFDLMMANQNDLARIMTTEQGKPLAESRGEWLMLLRSSNGLPKRAGAHTAT